MGRSFVPRPAITQPSDPRIRHIALTRGRVAIVDAEDYERLNQFRWTANGSDAKGGFYAMRWERHGTKVTGFMMHREIMSAPKGTYIDHVNCDGLDNRMVNLRYCTARQNMYNQRLIKPTASGFKGVSKHGRQFQARIGVAGEDVYIGLFDTPQEAHAAYIGAARIIAGEFARAA